MFKKNTAGQFIHVQGVDATTGGIKSGVSWTVRRCIDGTFAAATGTATEDGTTGWYKFAMSTADTNGNNIGFNFTGTGAVPQTVNIITDGAPPDVNVTKVDGTALDTHDAGSFPADVRMVDGAALDTHDAGSFPADVRTWVGAAPNALQSGRVDGYLGATGAVTVAANVTQIDGQATTGNNATLNLKQLNIVNNAGDAIIGTSTGSNGSGAKFTGNGSGPGLYTLGDPGVAANTGAGMKIAGAYQGHGMEISAATSTSVNKNGIRVTTVSGDAIYAKAATTQGQDFAGMYLEGSVANGGGAAAGGGAGLYLQGGAGTTGASSMEGGSGLRSVGGAGSTDWPPGAGISPRTGTLNGYTGNTRHGAISLEQPNGLPGIRIIGGPASGAVPAGVGVEIRGGAASTTSGGIAGEGITVLGGAGAASTNGAAAGVTVAAGGTTTVSGNDGMQVAGTGDGDGLQCAGAGSGVDIRANITGTVTVIETLLTRDIIEGTVNDAGATTTDFDGDSGLSASDDFYIGSVLAFTSGTLKGIARKITDYTGSSRNLVFTDAFPTAPGNGDAFEILGRID